MPRRPALSLDAIVTAAVAVADAGGLDRVTMRNVGKVLGVEAMSLYHHVAGKDALLGAIIDRVHGEVALPAADEPWRPAMAARAASARAVLSAHPWALGLMESGRAPGAAVFRHHEAVLANLRTNGFSVRSAAHAFSAIDAYVFGFVLTEQNLPFEAGEDAADFIEHIDDVFDAEAHPFMAEMMVEMVATGAYDFADEFGFGLDLVLDGIERHLVAEAS